jgi:hypothetical protein
MMAFGVWRFAFGVRRLSFRVWRSAFGVSRSTTERSSLRRTAGRHLLKTSRSPASNDLLRRTPNTKRRAPNVL